MRRLSLLEPACGDVSMPSWVIGPARSTRSAERAGHLSVDCTERANHHTEKPSATHPWVLLIAKRWGRGTGRHFRGEHWPRWRGWRSALWGCRSEDDPARERRLRRRHLLRRRAWRAGGAGRHVGRCRRRKGHALCATRIGADAACVRRQKTAPRPQPYRMPRGTHTSSRAIG